jgi:protein-S-isoprenylcysteine O-methyltransferase Ste14
MTSVINLMTERIKIVIQYTLVGDPGHYGHWREMNILSGRLHLHRRRIFMLSLSKTKPSITKQLIAPVLASICLALMLLLHWLYPIRLLIRFPFNLTGLLFSGLGLTVCFAAQRQFRKIGTTLYPFSQPGKLVTGGLFRYTRNPMYLGLTTFLSGVWLLLSSLSPGVFVIAFLLIADRWYIAYEEKLLLAVFGAEYATYRAKTPRWI